MPKLSFKKCIRKFWKRIRGRKQKMRNNGILPGVSGLPNNVRDSEDNGDGQGTMGEFVKCGKVYILKNDLEKRKKNREERRHRRMSWHEYERRNSHYTGWDEALRERALAHNVLYDDSERIAAAHQRQVAEHIQASDLVRGVNALTGNEEDVPIPFRPVRPVIVPSGAVPTPPNSLGSRGEMMRSSLLERYSAQTFHVDYSGLDVNREGEDNA